MRINVYAEELPHPDDAKAIEAGHVTTKGGHVFFGARLFLQSPEALHDTPDDDDRSAVTIWGPRARVAKLLRRMADEVEKAGVQPGQDGDVGGGLGRNMA